MKTSKKTKTNHEKKKHATGKCGAYVTRINSGSICIHAAKRLIQVQRIPRFKD